MAESSHSGYYNPAESASMQVERMYEPSRIVQGAGIDRLLELDREAKVFVTGCETLKRNPFLILFPFIRVD